MRRPRSVVLARLPFTRPFLIGVAALLLVGLVGAAVWWQAGVHAAPTRVNLSVVSDAGDQFTTTSGLTGSALITVGHAGCWSVDSNGICTNGVWTQIQPAIPGGHWIWPTVQWDPNTQGGNPVTFTKQFSVPENALNITGQILIAADNGYDLQVNGHELGAGHHLTQTDTYDLLTYLRTGTNTITAEVANDPTPTDPIGNPAGLIFRVDASYTPDNTAPTTAATLAGTLGNNGWYRGPITVTLQASDPDDSSSTLLTTYSTDGDATWRTYTTPLSFASDGQYSLQYRSVDQATNLEATQTVSFKIDQTPPELHVSGAASQTFDVCAVARPVRPTFAPTDTLSGLDGSQGDSWAAPTTATGAGVYTYTAHAQDQAGNPTSETRTYTVLYGAAFSGVLEPFKASQPNSFTLGSAIPVKFQLLCNGTPISTAVARLSVKQGSGTAATTQPKKLSMTNTFAYDSTDQQYHLNVKTGSGYTNPDGTVVTFAAGAWTFTIGLDDGISHAYTIQLS